MLKQYGSQQKVMRSRFALRGFSSSPHHYEGNQYLGHKAVITLRSHTTLKEQQLLSPVYKGTGCLLRVIFCISITPSPSTKSQTRARRWKRTGRRKGRNGPTPPKGQKGKKKKKNVVLFHTGIAFYTLHGFAFPHHLPAPQ